MLKKKFFNASSCSNTALLLVGKVEEGELFVCEEHGATPRLGAGLARTGCLEDVALERTVEVLRHFVERMDVNGVALHRRRFAGTAVLRRAVDAERLINRVREELGVVLEVLPEEEEARLLTELDSLHKGAFYNSCCLMHMLSKAFVCR